jgi:cation diffusion facilitator CzcD-associated flavoprotein CzcO
VGQDLGPAIPEPRRQPGEAFCGKERGKMRRAILLAALLCAWAAPLLGAGNDAASVNPFKQPGNWYRGNTHTHTTESDGKLAVAARCASYREAGYDFLVITDHGKVTDVSGLSDDKFLAIPGAEKFENKGVTYCASCDGPLFSGKDVAVIGGGNSALDACLQLIRIANRIYIINNTDDVVER